MGFPLPLECLKNATVPFLIAIAGLLLIYNYTLSGSLVPLAFGIILLILAALVYFGAAILEKIKFPKSGGVGGKGGAGSFGGGGGGGGGGPGGGKGGDGGAGGRAN